MSKFSEGKGAIYWDRMALNVSGLAALDAVSIAGKADGARTQGFRILKTEYYIHSDADVPLLVGTAGPTINAAEVEEAIEGDPQSPEDRPASEHVMRPVFVYGTTGVRGNGQEVIQCEKVIRWAYSEAGAMNGWV